VIEPSHPAGDATCPYCGSLLWFTNDPGEGSAYPFCRFTISDSAIRTKEQAIATILDRLVAAGSLEAEHRHSVFAAILKREELGSTAIGRGVAVPHATSSGIRHTISAMVRFSSDVEFDSRDRQPVRLVCLILSPADRPGEHLRLVESLARQLMTESHE
jgi:PTS system fructose-specific IIA component/PTS system nitrogen regulatory IIA component